MLGKRLQVAPQLNKEGYMNNHRVQFTQLTKREFLRNLRRQFQSKDYINLHFSKTASTSCRRAWSATASR